MPSGEGWYIDLNTGQSIPVHEHAYDIARNPQKFRINPQEIAGFLPTVLTDRDKLRSLALKRGFARVRSHGNSVVVEFDGKTEDAIPMVISFLIDHFDSATFVAFHNVATHKQYTDLRIGDLEDREKLDQILEPDLGIATEHKSIKLSSLYEDYDITPVGSKKYAIGTEKLVRGPKFGAGPGVKSPESGDISRISDVGSEPYSKDTVKPSEKPRKGSPKGRS